MSCITCMVLYIESTLDQYGIDLSKMEPLRCRVTELHITTVAYYTDLFTGKKKKPESSPRSRNNYQFKT